MRKPFFTASIGAMKLYLAMSSIEGVVPYFCVNAALLCSESEGNAADEVRLYDMPKQSTPVSHVKWFLMCSKRVLSGM